MKQQQKKKKLRFTLIVLPTAALAKNSEYSPSSVPVPSQAPHTVEQSRGESEVVVRWNYRIKITDNFHSLSCTQRKASCLSKWATIELLIQPRTHEH